IILQNGHKKHESRANIEQIMGRLMRLKGLKLGHVLCFKNVYFDVIKEMLDEQPVTFSVNLEFLAQSKMYYTNKHKKWFVTDVDHEKVNKIAKENSGFQIKFKIITRPITQFALKPPLEETQTLAPFGFDNDILAELTFGSMFKEI